MEDIAARRAAEALLAEHKANVRFGPLGPPDGPTTIPDAYDIQERYVALLRNEHGDAVGYKVGLTSAPMQAFCGIDHPIGGVVLARRVHRARRRSKRGLYPSRCSLACCGQFVERRHCAVGICDEMA